jgi:hypothetical protein
LLLNTINLAELDNQPTEIREAVAFYTAHTILSVQFTAEERARHYGVLEEAGYIERIGVAQA